MIRRSKSSFVYAYTIIASTKPRIKKFKSLAKSNIAECDLVKYFICRSESSLITSEISSIEKDSNFELSVEKIKSNLYNEYVLQQRLNVL